MIVDCHTHLWSYPGHLSEEFVAEANLMRSEPVDMNVDPDQHLKAMEQVDPARGRVPSVSAPLWRRYARGVVELGVRGAQPWPPLWDVLPLGL